MRLAATLNCTCVTQITADLSDAPRKLYHAEADLPVTAGPLTLTTPKWIPGDHRPAGPVESITGVVFTANGQTLEWRRDDMELYQFHVMVPQGVTTLHAHLDCIVLAFRGSWLSLIGRRFCSIRPTHRSGTFLYSLR